MKAPKNIDRWVYYHSKKPRHCVDVRNPPKTPEEKMARPQDARRLQYNRWSKRYKVYSGSYLPKDHNELKKKGRVNATNTFVKKNNSTNPSKFYRRKSTNQWVRCDQDHWHWYNWWLCEVNHKKIKKQDYLYYDKYGEYCKKGSRESHLKGEN